MNTTRPRRGGGADRPFCGNDCLYLYYPERYRHKSKGQIKSPNQKPKSKARSSHQDAQISIIGGLGVEL